MGWRFRKSIKILPGVKVNIGKEGFSSVSIGTRGAHITMGKNGTNLSAGIPGTGLSYTTRLDQPVGQNTTECPYCGHRMRKQWDACPKCRQPLIQQTPQPAAAHAAPPQGQPRADIADESSRRLRRPARPAASHTRAGCSKIKGARVHS